MKLRVLSWLRSGLAIEWSFAFITLASLVYCTIFLFQNHYLPSPFFYEPNDIYADWFNTAYWARDSGTYDVWQTLYPPLSFVFIRLVGVESCYLRNRGFDPSVGYPARECDWLGLSSIWLLLLLNIVLTYLVLRKVDKSTAIPRTICLGLGWPMLDGVERGNLVLVAFPCLVLAAAPLLRSARLKWLFAGLAINFKVYLVAAFVPLLLKRRWLFVECCLIATLIVYVISYAALGRGTPIEIFQNLRSWGAQSTVSPLDMWPATTYNALYSLLDGDVFPVMLLLGSKNIENIQLFIQVVLRTTQGMILLAAVATWMRPEAVSTSRAVLLGLMLALITSEAGGYTPTYFTLFIFMERWRGFGLKLAIFGCYLMAPSLDIPIDQVAPVVRDTYFGRSTTVVSFYVTAWPFVRPLVIQIIAIAIAATTIHDVWKDIGQQGWAERWRFRNDAPLLPWVQRPTPPSVGNPPQP